MSFDHTPPPPPPQPPVPPAPEPSLPGAGTPAALPQQFGGPAAPAPALPGSKSFLTTWLLSLLLGWTGADRFYLGKTGTGLLKLVTIGGLGVWWLIDLIIVLTGSTRDSRGLPLEGYQQHRKIAWIVTGSLVALSLIINAINAANGASSPNSAGAPAVSENASADDHDTETKPEPVVEEPAPVVPSVIGATVRDARSALEQVGLVLDAGGASDDAVIDTQSPNAGEETQDGATVTVSATEPAPPMTLSQENAVSKAQDYLDLMGFSRPGLIDQLEYEGFSIEDATFAVDYLAPDWNAEAAEKAQSYLDMMAMSRDGLYDQLEYEGFAPEQIEFALTAVGY